MKTNKKLLRGQTGTQKLLDKIPNLCFGEILLVMIGILLALKVNNWNENRKAVNQESKYLNTLLSELRLDSLTFRMK